MNCIRCCTADQGDEICAALDRERWREAPKGYSGLYLIKHGENCWEAIDSTSDEAYLETYRYRDSAVRWLLDGCEPGQGPIRDADARRWATEHPGEAYGVGDCPGGNP